MGAAVGGAERGAGGACIRGGGGTMGAACWGACAGAGRGMAVDEVEASTPVLVTRKPNLHFGHLMFTPPAGTRVSSMS